MVTDAGATSTIVGATPAPYADAVTVVVADIVVVDAGVAPVVAAPCRYRYKC